MSYDLERPQKIGLKQKNISEKLVLLIQKISNKDSESLNEL